MADRGSVATLLESPALEVDGAVEQWTELWSYGNNEQWSSGAVQKTLLFPGSPSAAAVLFASMTEIHTTKSPWEAPSSLINP